VALNTFETSNLVKFQGKCELEEDNIIVALHNDFIVSLMVQYYLSLIKNSVHEELNSFSQTSSAISDKAVMLDYTNRYSISSVRLVVSTYPFTSTSFQRRVY
jgi:hypothetical protein